MSLSNPATELDQTLQEYLTEYYDIAQENQTLPEINVEEIGTTCLSNLSLCHKKQRFYMSDAKKYKLLKDLPDAESGTIWELSNKGNDYKLQSDLRVAKTYPRRIVENKPQWFEEIKEKPKKVLTYSNGALVDEPEEDTPVWIIDFENKNVLSAIYDENELNIRQIFPTKQAATKWAYCLEVQARLEKEIIKIHDEEGWICDWEDMTQQKYHLSYNHEYKERDSYELDYFNGGIQMSKKAKEYMLNKSKVSDNEYFAFLGLVDLVDIFGWCIGGGGIIPVMREIVQKLKSIL